MLGARMGVWGGVAMRCTSWGLRSRDPSWFSGTRLERLVCSSRYSHGVSVQRQLDSLELRILRPQTWMWSGRSHADGDACLAAAHVGSIAEIRAVESGTTVGECRTGRATVVEGAVEDEFDDWMIGLVRVLFRLRRPGEMIASRVGKRCRLRMNVTRSSHDRQKHADLTRSSDLTESFAAIPDDAK